MSAERAELERRCAAAGIAAGYHDIRGTWHTVPEASLRALLAELGPEAGAPPRCYVPPGLSEGPGFWGVSAQLYALRSARNWGIGDFSDLATLVEIVSAHGAALVGLNPLHALFPHQPARASPYSPSSRLRLNVLYLDVESIDDFRECREAQALAGSEAFQARLAGLREAPLVDYPGVAHAKLETLERLYAHFRENHLAHGTDRAAAFRAFQAAGGESLRHHALFEARTGQRAGESLERIEFFEYLQWQAETQLARAAGRCRALGMPVGLYLDLAVSPARDGSEVRADPECYASGASIGAPPDDFNTEGQDWDLPPLRPQALRERGFEPFAAALRAAMRNAGAIRIDHVMGLMRLFWIPRGKRPAEGAYVHYPMEELFAIVARESRRHGCVVVGEDLGTVPDEVRVAAARAGVLATRLLYFERAADGELRAPAEYPRDALVAIGTHDLPPLAGWWESRPEDRGRLLRALERERLRPENCGPESATLPPAVALATHAFLARTPARLMVVQLEDVFGVRERTNVPGTTHQHPNWRRKLPVTLEAMDCDDRLELLARTLNRERR